MTFLGLLVLEVTLSLAYLAADRVRASSPASLDGRSRSDVYTDVAWVNDYFRELEESAVTQWTSYVYWRRQPYQGRHINVDAEGIRRTWNCHQEERGAVDPLKVFTFGGSAMWGVGARDEFTIPSYLAKALKERGIRCEVTNFGESGYVSTQEAVALLQELRNGNIPDLVIFYDGVNDIYSAYQQQKAGLPQNEFHRAQEFNVSQPRSHGSLRLLCIRRWISRLAMVRFSRNLLRKAGIEVDPSATATHQSPMGNAIGGDTLFREVLAVYKGNMRAVRALGESYGFKALFYWQPTVFSKGAPTAGEQQVQQEIWDLQPYCENMCKLVQQESLSGAHYGVLHDMSGVFSQVQQPVFIDWCHISEWGNEQIARRMAADTINLIGDNAIAGSNDPRTLLTQLTMRSIRSIRSKGGNRNYAHAPASPQP